MYIVRSYSSCGYGETLEEAVSNFEAEIGGYFDPDECSIYEAKEIKVQRKFEVIKEN